MIAYCLGGIISIVLALCVAFCLFCLGNKKIEYFLNAIHYSLYKWEVWSSKIVERHVKVVFVPILKLFMSENRIKKNIEDSQEYLYGEEYGQSISLAHHFFGYFSSAYSGFFSFVLIGLCGPDLNPIMMWVFLVTPIAIGYIPVYKSVFWKDRYLKYFKQFKKKDARWHKKWRIIMIAYCLGGILSTVLGLCVAFCLFCLGDK